VLCLGLKAGKEAVQLLCQCHIKVPGCCSTASVVGDGLYVLPHLPGVVELLLYPPLMLCFGGLDASPQVGTSGAVQCQITRSEVCVAGPEERVDLYSHPWLLIWKHLDALFHSDHINAVLDVRQYCVYECIQVFMVEGFPLRLFEAILNWVNINLKKKKKKFYVLILTKMYFLFCLQIKLNKMKKALCNNLAGDL